MKIAPALAKKRGSQRSHLSRITVTGRSAERQPLNQDLIQPEIAELSVGRDVTARNSREERAKISFIYNAGKSDTGSYGSNSQIPRRNISTKLCWAQDTFSPPVNRSPPPIISEKIRVENLYTDRDEQQNQQKNQMKSVLAAVMVYNSTPQAEASMPAQVADLTTFPGSIDRNGPHVTSLGTQYGLDLAIQSSEEKTLATILGSPLAQQAQKTQQPFQPQQQPAPLLPNEQQIMAAQIESNQRAWQKTLGDTKKSVQHEKTQWLSVGKHIMIGKQANRHQKSQNLHVFKPNVSDVSVIGVSLTNDQHRSLIQTANIGVSKGQSPSESAINAQQFMPSLTQLQIAAASQAPNAKQSAKILYQAAKIQRIQIVNKPGILRGVTEDYSGHNHEFLHPADVYRDEENRKIFALSPNNEPTSSVNVSSTNQSPLCHTVSSYLRNQKFVNSEEKTIVAVLSSNTHEQSPTNFIASKRSSLVNKNDCKTHFKSPNRRSKPQIENSQRSDEISPGQSSPKSFVVQPQAGPNHNFSGNILLLQENPALEVVSQQIQSKLAMSSQYLHPIQQQQQNVAPAIKPGQESYGKLRGLPRGKSLGNPHQALAQRMRLSYNDLCEQGIEESSHKDRQQRTRRPTLAAVLDADDNQQQQASFFDSQKISYNHHKHIHAHEEQCSSAQRLGQESQSVQKTLPKLQFVVKYARRSRHESTIRYRNMNLQGSKTHIMPLNLVQQNSLYFIEDEDIRRIYDEQHTGLLGSPRDAPSNLPALNDVKYNEGEDNTRQSARDMMQMMQANNQQNIVRRTEDNFPTADKSSLAWLRQQRGSFGYIQSLNGRPKRNTKMAKTQKHNRSPIEQMGNVESRWDGLCQRMMVGQKYLNDLASAQTHNMQLAEGNNSSHDQNLLNNSAEASQGEDRAASSGINTNSRGRLSSAENDYQSFIMRPKILPSSAGADQGSEQMGLSSAHGFGKVNIESAGGLGDYEVVSEKRNLDQHSNANNVAVKFSNLPRTSQLERRTRLMHVKSGENDLMQNLEPSPLQTMKRNIILNQSCMIDTETKKNTVASVIGSVDVRQIVKDDTKDGDGQRMQRGKGVYRVEAPGRRLENINTKARRERLVHHLTMPFNIMKPGQIRSDDMTFKEFIIEKKASPSKNKDKQRFKSKQQQQHQNQQDKGNAKDPTSRVPLASSDFSQEEATSSYDASKAFLGLGEIQTSLHSSGELDLTTQQSKSSKNCIVAQKTRMPQNVGKLMSQMLGINPRSKQSTLMQSRISKLIASGLSPFQEQSPQVSKQNQILIQQHEQLLQEQYQRNAYQDYIKQQAERRSQQRLDNSSLIVSGQQMSDSIVLLQKSQKKQNSNKVTGSSSPTNSIQKAHRIMMEPLHERQPTVELKDYSLNNRSKCQGVQVLRDGQLSKKKLSSDLSQVIESASPKAVRPDSQDTSEVASIEPALPPSGSIAAREECKTDTTIYDCSSSLLMKQPEMQDKRLVVQMNNTLLGNQRKSTLGLVSLEKVTVNEQADQNGDSPAFKVGITQATVSQIELNDQLPTNDASRSFIIDQLGSESVTQQISTVEPLLIIPPQLEVCVVTNDASKKQQQNEMCQTEPTSPTDPQPKIPIAVSKARAPFVVAAPTIYRGHAKVRPGINKILPKELVDELLESQGRRKVEQLMRNRHKSVKVHQQAANTHSPTRDYLERKFNENRRQREVNFFKQAKAMQIPACETNLNIDLAASMRSKHAVAKTVLNYESGSREFKVDGINLLTGARTRAKPLLYP